MGLGGGGGGLVGFGGRGLSLGGSFSCQGRDTGLGLEAK